MKPESTRRAAAQAGWSLRRSLWASSQWRPASAAARLAPEASTLRPTAAEPPRLPGA